MPERSYQKVKELFPDSREDSTGRKNIKRNHQGTGIGGQGNDKAIIGMRKKKTAKTKG